MNYTYINAIILLSIIAIIYCILVYYEEKHYEEMKKR
jgi:hypothetical protein